MAIQNRRGLWSDLDTSKLRPGEFAVSTDHKVVVCQSTGVIKTFMSEEDSIEVIDAELNICKEKIVQSVEASVTEIMTDYKERIETDFKAAEDMAAEALSDADNAVLVSAAAKETADTALIEAQSAVETSNLAKSEIENEIQILENLVLTKTGIDDSVTSQVQTWSSEKIAEKLSEAGTDIAIDDTVTSTEKVWSSEKVSNEIANGFEKNVQKVDIVNDTLCSEEGKVLDARQGWVLNEKITHMANTVETKQNKAIMESAVLLTAAWTGTTAPFTHDLTIPDTYDFELSLPATATKEQIEACQNAQVVSSGNDNIIRAWGDKPTIDIPVVIRKWVR